MKLLLGLFLFILCGCNSREVQVKNEVFKSNKTNLINNLKIVNNTPHDIKVNSPAFSEHKVYLRWMKPHSREIVKEDVENYFKQFLGHNERNLVVTINKANSYFLLAGASQIPIVSLATIGTPRTVGVDLEIMFEVEVNGKVLKSYSYSKNFEIKSSSSREDVYYKELMTKYGDVVFKEIEDIFVARYL